MGHYRQMGDSSIEGLGLSANTSLRERGRATFGKLVARLVHNLMNQLQLMMKTGFAFVPE